MAKEIYSMRKKLVNEKRDMLKQMSPRDLVDKIVDYPNQTILNRDEEGHKRHFPIAVMAKAIKENDYKMSEKQYYTLIHQFTAITVPDMKVAGVSFRENNPTEFKKTLTAEKGNRSQYDINYILQPEPDNPYDKNAVKVMIEKNDGNLHQLGYVPADFVAAHPITEEMTVHGQFVDWSHGKFKNCSYDIALDVEEIDAKAVRDKALVMDDLPFPITTMKVDSVLIDDKEKMKVHITEGSNTLLQKTYFEGSHFVKDTEAKNPHGYPLKSELLGTLYDNYKADKLEIHEPQSILVSDIDLDFAKELDTVLTK